MSSSRVQKNSGFLKTKPTGFLGVLLGFGLYCDFGLFFCLHEQLGSLLVDLAHQLNFYLDMSVLPTDYDLTAIFSISFDLCYKFFPKKVSLATKFLEFTCILRLAKIRVLHV